MVSNESGAIVFSIFLGIFLLTYWMIISPRFNKNYSAFLGGTLVLVAGWLLHQFSELELVAHLEADFLVLAIIVGNLLVVDVGSKSGLFHFISIKILKLTKGSPIRLMIYMGILSIVLSIVVNNISAILIAGSLTIIACQRLDYDPYPYLMSEMILVNVGGLYTLVSSVPNIIIGTELGISYIDFLRVSIIAATLLVVASYATFFITLKLPKSSLSAEEREKAVSEFDEWAAVHDKRFFYATAVILGLMVFFFAISSFIGLGLATISIAGATAMIFVSGVDFDEAISSVDWPLLAFFMGLFVVIASLDIVGIINMIAQGITATFGTNEIIAALVILWFSALLSGIVDNIVIAAALSPVIVTVASSTGMDPIVLAWALIIGANLGGDFTPIGSPSNVIGMGILAKRTGVKLGWGDWKYPAYVTIIHLIVASVLVVILSVFS